MSAIVTELVPVVGSLVMAILGWALVKLTAWVNTKTKNTYLLGVYARLDEAVTTAVQALEQTVVRDTKDGLTATTGAQLKADCLALVKKLIGPEGLAALIKIVGADELQTLLSNKIEATVLRVSQQSAVVSAAQAASSIVVAPAAQPTNYVTATAATGQLPPPPHG